ncbi:MAG: transporter [Myxococcota bacterium]
MPRRLLWLLGLTLLSGVEGRVLAQDVRDGDTLPAHAGGLIVNPGFSFGTNRFGPGWRFFKRESILTDFDNLDLANIVVGNGASQLEGLIQGTLGVTHFSASQKSIGLQFTAAYGVTDRLTIAVVVPFGFASYDLDTYLSGVKGPDELSHYGIKDASAITCKGGNLQINQPEDLFKILDYVSDTYRFNVGDLGRALSSPCLGYKNPIDSTYTLGDYTHGVGHRSYGGIRDMIMGAKYQWFHGERLHLSTLLYVVAPTGKPDDPDDLFDPAYGDGQWDAALLTGVTIPLGNFRIVGSAGYEIQFGDQIVRRLSGLSFDAKLEGQLARGEISEQQLYADHLDEGSILPIVPAYEKALVSRKLGDNIYVYTGAYYQILEWLSVGVTVDFIHHFRDAITDTGTHIEDGKRYPTSAEIRAQVDAEIAAGTLDASKKEEELIGRLSQSAERKAAAYAWHTVRDTLTMGFGLQVNTLAAFGRGDFPIPLLTGISATIPIGGQNIDALDSIGMNLTIPFITGDVKDPEEYGADDDPDPSKGLPWP